MNSDVQSSPLAVKFVSDFQLNNSWILDDLKDAKREEIWNQLYKSPDLQWIIAPADDLTAEFIKRCGFDIDTSKQSILRDEYGLKYRVFRRVTSTVWVVDVIVTCYNCERFIDKCIGSIVSTTALGVPFNGFPLNLKVIVVDDCSTDNSLAKLSDWIDHSQVHIISYHENLGASGARNAGLGRSTAPFVIFFDGDDKMNPHMIESLCEEYLRHKCDFVYPGYWRIKGDPDFKAWSELEVHGAAVVRSGDSLWMKIQEFDPVRVEFVNYLQTTCLIKHSWAKSTPWLEDVFYLNDWAWYLQLIRKGAVGRRCEKASFTYTKFSRAESLTHLYRREYGFEARRSANRDRLREYDISPPYTAVSIRWAHNGLVCDDWVHHLRQLPLASYGGMHVDICKSPSRLTSTTQYDVYIFHDLNFPTCEFISKLPSTAIVVVDLTVTNSFLYDHCLSALKRANLVITADPMIEEELSESLQIQCSVLPTGLYNGHLFHYVGSEIKDTVNLYHPCDTHFHSTDVLMVPELDLPIPTNTHAKKVELWNPRKFFLMKYGVNKCIRSEYELESTHHMIHVNSNRPQFYKRDTLIHGERLQKMIRDVYEHCRNRST